LGNLPIPIRIRSVYAIGLTDHLLSQLASGKDNAIEIDAGTTVKELLQRLSSLGPVKAFDDIMIHVFVNGTVQGFDYVLQPQDIVDIHIPVSGG
jgi:molybdopterin converting factor small subunit